MKNTHDSRFSHRKNLHKWAHPHSTFTSTSQILETDFAFFKNQRIFKSTNEHFTTQNFRNFISSASSSSVIEISTTFFLLIHVDQFKMIRFFFQWRNFRETFHQLLKYEIMSNIFCFENSLNLSDFSRNSRIFLVVFLLIFSPIHYGELQQPTIDPVRKVKDVADVHKLLMRNVCRRKSVWNFSSIFSCWEFNYPFQ